MFLHRMPARPCSAGEPSIPEEEDGQRTINAAQLGNPVDVLIHELKQPLLCILVLGERLEGMLKGAREDSFPKAAIAKRDVAALLASVQQMRDVMSARSALANLAWVERDWSARLTSQLEALDAVAAAHGVTLAVSNGMSERSEGPDLGALGQVLSNLVTNAIHALQEGAGEDDKRKILVELWQTEKRLTLQVHDSGPGVSSEITSKIFTRGFSTKQARGGSGYGLWVCRKLAEALGGAIVVERSDKLAGACFKVDIPLERPAEDPSLDSVA